MIVYAGLPNCGAECCLDVNGLQVQSRVILAILVNGGLLNASGRLVRRNGFSPLLFLDGRSVVIAEEKYFFKRYQ